MNLFNPSDPSDQPEDFNADMLDPGADDVVPEGDLVAPPKRRRIDGSSLLLFGLIASVCGATYIMVKVAGGNQIGFNTAVASANSTIKSFLTGGVPNLRQSILMERDTEKVVSQFNSYPSAHQVPASDLKGNPFGVEEIKQTPTVALSEDASKRLEEQQRQDAERVAAGLKLESVVFGSHSACMINGKTFAVGQRGDSFTVEKILPDSVWVQIGPLQKELKMTPPSLQ
ncbi:MAG: hypothetical protein ABSH22_04025 [Tepidisphaeraceae bacterium]|jgi:hypothetical protein